mmetsp:Transcript_107901/g.170430  ORF Transcript_107901/g.170430 Transcript_107901/m.170430 type:complete len:226 (-) Transcript_107901:7-684(-)
MHLTDCGTKVGASARILVGESGGHSSFASSRAADPSAPCGEETCSEAMASAAAEPSPSLCSSSWRSSGLSGEGPHAKHGLARSASFCRAPVGVFSPPSAAAATELLLELKWKVATYRANAMSSTSLEPRGSAEYARRGLEVPTSLPLRCTKPYRNAVALLSLLSEVETSSKQEPNSNSCNSSVIMPMMPMTAIRKHVRRAKSAGKIRRGRTLRPTSGQRLFDFYM